MFRKYSSWMCGIVVSLLIVILISLILYCYKNHKNLVRINNQLNQEINKLQDKNRSLVTYIDDLESKCQNQIKRDKLLEVALRYAKSHIPESVVSTIIDTALSEPNSLLLISLITVESHFDIFAKSSRGAVGCGQIKVDSWDKELKSVGLIKSYRDYFDPKICVKASSYILNKILNEHGVVDSLTIYNCGESNWKKGKCSKKFAYKVLSTFGDYYYSILLSK